jgi:UDP-N-acetylmuramyl pentapeptide synthase
MQPYNLGGALIIDDTYNGNLEGIKRAQHFLASCQQSGNGM